MLKQANATSKKESNKKQPTYSFDDIQETLFELRDEFDMFYNPHGKFDYTEEEAEQDRKNYLVSGLIRANCVVLV